MNTYPTTKRNPVSVFVVCLALVITCAGTFSCKKEPQTQDTVPPIPEKPRDTIRASGVILDTTTLVLYVGDTAMLKATVVPDSAEEKTITWFSSQEAVVKVNANGKLTAIAVGTGTITATAGKKQAVCTVTVSPDVYVAGSESLPSGVTVATLWKNGKTSHLTNNGDGEIRSIFISGNDIYATGNDRNKPVFWKNNALTYLSNVQSQSSGNSICVSGNDVYIAGYDYFTRSPLLHVGTYWKNGILEHPGGTTNYSDATAVAVSGNVVYVAGAEQPGKFPMATIWKNGVPTHLTNGTSNAWLTSIFVSGNDVYAAGGEADGDNYWVATIWKNGVPILRLTDRANIAEIYSIYVSGNDVYAVGDRSSLTTTLTYIATVWKNGVETHLTDGTNSAIAFCVNVQGNDVLVGGYEEINSIPVATLWRNGKAQHLGTANSFAQSLFVKQP